MEKRKKKRKEVKGNLDYKKFGKSNLKKEKQEELSEYSYSLFIGKKKQLLEYLNSKDNEFFETTPASFITEQYKKLDLNLFSNISMFLGEELKKFTNIYYSKKMN